MQNLSLQTRPAQIRTERWVVVLALLVIVGISLGVLGLRGFAFSRIEMTAILSGIEAKANHLSALEWQAIAEERLEAELSEAVEQTQQAIDQDMASLVQLKHQYKWLDRPLGLGDHDELFNPILATYTTYTGALKTEFDLLNKGLLEEAEEVDEQQVDPSFEALHEALQKASQRLETEARWVYELANLGLIGSLLVVGLTVWWMMGRVNNLRKSAELVAVEQRTLRESEERFRALVQNANDIIVVLQRDQTISYSSPALKTVLGYEESQLLGQDFYALVHPDDGVGLEVFRNKLSEAGQARGEFRFKSAGQGWRFMEVQGSNLLAEPGVQGVVLNARDIGQRKALEDQLSHQAFHDPLTGLPNRALFQDRLQHALTRAGRQGRMLAVLFLDLDRFKVVNDTLGHHSGDELLTQVARRLQDSVRESDTVTRLGGDEFTVLLEEAVDLGEVTDVAERILQSLKQPFWLQAQEVFINASIGIATGHASEKSHIELMRDADIAMYQAKSRGRGRYHIFEQADSAALASQVQLEAELRRGIERGEFVLHYQPQMDIQSGKIVAFEALVRWQHPLKGLLSPAHFIDLAENTGLIQPLGKQVLEIACQQAVRWDPVLAPRISVNLSLKQLRQPNLVEEIAQVLRDSGLEPSRLELEITESAVVEDPVTTNQTLTRLRALGVRLAMDDFGTGYSSLGRLKQFPLDVLKIDRSFIKSLGSSDDDLAIVQAVVELGRALKLEVVAEGVETEGQIARLKDLHCSLAQGYYYAKPMPAEEVEALLSKPVLV